MEEREVRHVATGHRNGQLRVILLLLAVFALSDRLTVADDVVLQVQKGPSASQITLSWTGGSPPLSVYRATSPNAVESPANLLGTVAGSPWIETPPADPQLFYLVVPPAAPVCGNSVREAGEQCDDGNLVNLDGCDSSCRFEQAQRAIWFKMQFTTDAICTPNRLGGAISGIAQGQLQTSIDTSVADGSFSVILSAQNPLTDLSGANEPSFQLGFLNGVPVSGSGPYDGTNDLDWWYTVSPLTPNRTPANLLPASITAHVLSAGPGRVVLPGFFSNSAPLVFAAARLTGTTGASSTPLVSGTGFPPGHLPSEHLDPLLTSYATLGTPTAAGAAHLCGNVVAASMAAAPLPQTFITTCSSDGYTVNNSLLDMFVHGCHALFITLIQPIQPDLSDPAAPVAGAGPPYTLTADPVTRVVNACRDHNNAIVDLPTCLNSAAYSSFFKIATDRVIPK